MLQDADGTNSKKSGDWVQTHTSTITVLDGDRDASQQTTIKRLLHEGELFRRIRGAFLAKGVGDLCVAGNRRALAIGTSKQ